MYREEGESMTTHSNCTQNQAYVNGNPRFLSNSNASFGSCESSHQGGEFPPSNTFDYGRYSWNSSLHRAGAYRNYNSDPKAYKPHIGTFRAVKWLGAVAFSVILLACAHNALENGSFETSALAREFSQALGGSESSENAVSTPAFSWTKGSMPYLYQTDSVWANEPYAGGKMATHGCGPTALSMVDVYWNGKAAKDPAAMAKFSENNGYVESGATAWRFMKEGASQLGMRSTELSASRDSVLSLLRAGTPIVCCVGPGDFTTEGHFIVLAGIDEKGKVIVRDPNSVDRSNQTWDVDRIIRQTRNLWAISK